MYALSADIYADLYYLFIGQRPSIAMHVKANKNFKRACG
jgi:hypothetical protein